MLFGLKLRNKCIAKYALNTHTPTDMMHVLKQCKLSQNTILENF